MKDFELHRWLPLGSGLLIFFGALKISFFYGQFDVPVISYLTVSEILTLFLNDIQTIIPLIIIGILHSCMSIDATKYINVALLYSVIIRYKIYYRLFFGIGFVIFSFLLLSGCTIYALWNIYLFVFFGVQFLFYIFIDGGPGADDGIIRLELHAEKFVFVCCTFLAGSIIPLLALHDAHDVRQRQHIVEIIYDDGEIFISDSSSTYLGKAGSYYFFSNRVGFEALRDDKIERMSIIMSN